MSGRRRVVYDTRFIAAIYHPRDEDEKGRIRRELTGTLSRYVSSVTVYELYKLTIQVEDKQTAELRAALLRDDFRIVNVDWGIAKAAGLLWNKYRVPMADAIIAATAMHLKATCVTNDPHLEEMKELKTRWV